MLGIPLCYMYVLVQRLVVITCIRIRENPIYLTQTSHFKNNIRFSLGIYEGYEGGDFAEK